MEVGDYIPGTEEHGFCINGVTVRMNIPLFVNNNYLHLMYGKNKFRIRLFKLGHRSIKSTKRRINWKTKTIAVWKKWDSFGENAAKK